MSFLAYVRQTSRIREDTARTRPKLFLFMEIGRHAAVMALVLIIADATPLGPSRR